MSAARAVRTGIATAGLLVATALAPPSHAGARKCADGAGPAPEQGARCDAAPSRSAPAKPPLGTDVRASVNPKADAQTRHDAPPTHGAWRGAAQFRYVSGAPLDASADADIELALLPDGRLEGGAVGAGCRLDGVHAPQQRVKNILTVDITISGCRDARFDAHYAGQLDASHPAHSRLRLHAITAISPATTDGYRELSLATIDAALRR